MPAAASPPMVKMMNSCTVVLRQNDQSPAADEAMQSVTIFAANPMHPHKEFSFCCCCAVKCTTFLGLQFQMDCVGRVIDLSYTIPLASTFMRAKHGEDWGFSLESVNLATGAWMPPASQFVTAAAWFSTHVTVRLAPQA